MTPETILVFFILIASIVLFITGWMRMDVVALLVMVCLAITGIVSPEEALSGFSNPAVITVWAMFILSAAFYQTGVARIIGKQILKLVGESEWRVILVIMLASGMLSSIMNNIGVAALMLPVVMDIARSTDRSPSRLLLPLAFGTHLGGLTTLIGTPPNLLISVNLENAGHRGLGMFDFTPVGLGVMIGGTLFVAFIGRHFLASRASKTKKKRIKDRELRESYHLSERTFMMQVPKGSQLEGKTLAESRLRPALGVNVLSVKRDGGGTILNPGPDTIIRANDKLFVQGRYNAIKALQGYKLSLPGKAEKEKNFPNIGSLSIYEAIVGEKSSLAGSNAGRDFKGFTLLAIRRTGTVLSGNLRSLQIQVGDTLLLQSTTEQMEESVANNQLESFKEVIPEKLRYIYKLHDAIFLMVVGEVSELFAKAVSYNQLGEVFGLKVLAISRQGEEFKTPKRGEIFYPSDKILVLGNPAEFGLLKAFTEIDLPDEHPPTADSLETGNVIMAEVVLAPRSLMAGKTLGEINFRKKYGLTVLAFWREGRAFRTNLHSMPLRYGEALLVYGTREKIALLGSEPDFILLTDTMQQPLRTNKALTATLVMTAILLPVILGYIPIAIAALMGVALMVMTGCLKMEEAYRAIEWRSVFLIAGMLPLGVAMQQSGAAGEIANVVNNVFGPMGPWGILTGLYLITMTATLALHPAAIVVIMSPIVLQAAESFSISPHSLMIAVSIAASASFLSPVAHPANLLILGPGGYKFTDYIKFGLPLALVVMAIVFLLIPLFWPLLT
jgi:di/tricarboxylate transporter